MAAICFFIDAELKKILGNNHKKAEI